MSVTIGRWLGKGWDLFTRDVGYFVLIALIYLGLLLAALVMLPGPGFIASIVIAWVFMPGLFLACIKKIATGAADVKDFFDGFKFFIQSLLAALLITVFTALGLIFCVVPGLVIAAMYMFTYLFIIDRGLDFWQAMESSRKLVANDYFGFTLFWILLALLNFLGSLLLGVGLLVSIPWSVAAITYAYQELVGFQTQPLSAAPQAPIKIP